MNKNTLNNPITIYNDRSIWFYTSESNSGIIGMHLFIFYKEDSFFTKVLRKLADKLV